MKSKIRELFNLSPFTPLNITYVDKENDVITLGDDQDLVDACVVQRLNPLRLEVRVPSEKQKGKEKAHDAKPSSVENNNDDKNNSRNNNGNNIPNVDVENLLKAVFTQATLGLVKNFVQTHTAQFVDPKLTGEVLDKANESLKEVLNNVNKFSACKVEETCQEVLNNLNKFSSQKAEGKKQSDVGEKDPGSSHHHEEKPHNQEDKEKSPVIHHGVECDVCHRSPIVGSRYKSSK